MVIIYITFAQYCIFLLFLLHNPPLSCPVPEILCGDPPILPHTGQVWSGSSTPGSIVAYYCKIGFYHNGGHNVSVCTITGSWTKPNISCKGNSLLQPAVSAVVTYFFLLIDVLSTSLEVDCGMPPPILHSVTLWDKVSTVGSRVFYQCKSGYRNVGWGNVSVCTASGKWDEASLLCQGDDDVNAKCVKYI